jgi:hypothetical protein
MCTIPLPALTLLAGLLSAAAAQANDRDLRAAMVPASACTVLTAAAPIGFRFARDHVVLATTGTGQAVSASLRCPLPVNNIDLGGTSNDNDLSKVRVHYKDSDGAGQRATVSVALFRGVVASAAPEGVTSGAVCQWNSNTGGSGATGGTKATFACPHDLAAEAFYTFQVDLAVQPGISPLNGHRCTV